MCIRDSTQPLPAPSTNPFALEHHQPSAMPSMQPTMPSMQPTAASPPPAAVTPTEAPSATPAPSLAAPPPKGFIGTITQAFVPFLPLYAEQEAGKLNELVATVSTPEAVLESTDEARVLSGSCEVFIAIRGSMQRCAKINNNMLLEELYRSALRPALSNYGRFLCAQGANPDHELRTMCHIANSGKYCMETVAELESALHKMGGGAARSMAAWDVFSEAEELAISNVVRSVMSGLEPSLKKVSGHGTTGSRWSRTRRKSNESNEADLGTQGSGFGGGCSMYVDELAKSVKHANATLLKYLMDGCFDLVAGKFVLEFSDTYLQQILSCDNLSAQDVQQLLNDTATVQIILIEMQYPAALMGEQAPAGMQMAMVEMGKIIGMLETLTADQATMAARYLQLVPNGTPEQLKQLLGTLEMGRRDVDTVLKDFAERRSVFMGAAEEQGEFSPDGDDSSSRSGLHIRNRLRGFRDRLKTELRNGTNSVTSTVSNSTIVKGGYLDRMIG
eukprot:TRINITY_DN8107_c0_g1_i1.p1 TRINITY_DN8107_c0_g1~~TRINITY_DN8107_c0_g1_i1.p1  ORF type:complete len:502 (+),score=117.71 TRINITY_DN8107_c0_g1_i1:73-1578(+)